MINAIIMPMTNPGVVQSLVRLVWHLCLSNYLDLNRVFGFVEYGILVGAKICII